MTLNFTQEFTDEFSVTAKTDVFYNYAGTLNEVDLAWTFIALYKIKEAFSLMDMSNHSRHRPNRCLATPFGVGCRPSLYNQVVRDKRLRLFNSKESLCSPSEMV
jgi:hypothetical protein